MLGAAVYRALDQILARFGGGEPHGVVAPRHRVHLEPEGWDEEAVNDVLGGQHQFDRLAGRHVQFGGLALAGRQRLIAGLRIVV